MSVTVTVSGKSGNNVTATSGDTVNVTLSPTGTPGGVGPQGPPGPATSLSIGNIFSGDTAGAAITGTAPNQVLSLTLPRGDKGAQGAKGDTGATGATGPAGPANSLSIGTVTSGTAAATITGTAPTQTLNLTLPAGPKGDTGSTGPAGPANTLTIGTVNSGSSPSATITGTAPNQILNLVLARGDKGEAGATGAAGPANSLTIGSVTEGSSAGASITGTAPNQTLNLTMPVNSLAIGTVTTGAAGSSATATITGTAPSQTLSLTIPRGDKGETGATGATGAAGPANSLSIGTVTTGAAGSSASATITGTAPTQTLNLTIPRGDKGDAGSGGGSFSWASVPATSSSSGTAGDLAYDSNRLYICTATNTWRASSLTRWDGDPYWSSVALLLAMNGADDGTTFTDLSSAARTVTRGGSAVTKTGTKKYGSASAYFAASGDFLSLADTDGLELGSSDWAMEMWINTTSSTQYATLFSRSPSSFGSGMWSLMINYASSTAGDIAFFAGDINALSPAVSGGSGLRDGAWHHVAVSRSGSTLSLYVDGSRVSTATSSVAIANISHGINIARDEFNGRQFVGHVDDLRLTIGSARGYTGSTITTPAAAFTDF